MSEITTTVWGIAPWSSELLTLDGDVGRGRRDPVLRDCLEGVEEEQFAELLSEQAITDHEGSTFRWPDYLRPLVEVSEGFAASVDTAPVTRWFDTNTFYRQPVIQGPLRLKDSRAWRQLVDAGRVTEAQPTLLSPYAFAELSAVEGAVDESQKLELVTDLYDELLGQYEAAGVRSVLLYEPYAPYVGATPRDVSRLHDVINRLAFAHPNISLGLYAGYGDASNALAKFSQGSFVDAIGCDLSRTDVSRLPIARSQRFIAGIVDVSNTELEVDDKLHDRIRQLVARVQPAALTLTHQQELEHIPPEYAVQKIVQLGRIARQTTKEELL